MYLATPHEIGETMSIKLKIILVSLVVIASLGMNANAAKTSNAAPDTQPDITSTSSVARYVSEQAKVYGVDPKVALFIVQHESQFRTDVVGDDGISLGAWQINVKAHPDIRRNQALDLVWSTTWAMKELKAGHARIWSTYRFCRKWYGICPY